ncbi:MAG: hypothetical protein IKU42_05660 [Oscillospiraceae bacterium]|nr:hypothetical protein [Oscillospiraceae bacterium]
MSEFDDFIRGIGSDIKNVAEQVGKKAEETFEISKRKAERMTLKGNIQKNYQKLGELVYGGIKNDEDIQNEMEAIVAELDFNFARIAEIYEEIGAIKNGTYVPEDEEEDWEEEYAEEYDEEYSDEEYEEEPEVEVALVIEENGEIIEEPAEVVAEESNAKKLEFDINID